MRCRCDGDRVFENADDAVGGALGVAAVKLEDESVKVEWQVLSAQYFLLNSRYSTRKKIVIGIIAYTGSVVETRYQCPLSI